MVFRKGVADGEIAKQEAERARKRELEERDEELIRSAPKRQRSVSSDSVSTISTDASADSQRRSLSRSPQPRRRRSLSPSHESDQDERGGRVDDSRSPSPPRRRRRSMSRDSRSPPREPREKSYRSRDLSPPRDYHDARAQQHRRRFSSGSRASRDSRPLHRGPSRSPDANRRDFEERGRYAPRGGRGESHHAGPREDRLREPPTEAPPRERSLSPFSKRLALTQSMNSGGR